MGSKSEIVASALEIVSDGATFWCITEDVDAVDSWILMPAAMGSMSCLGSIVSEFESSFHGGRSVARLLRAATAPQGCYGHTKGGDWRRSDKHVGRTRNRAVRGKLKWDIQSEFEFGPVLLPKWANDWLL